MNFQKSSKTKIKKYQILRKKYPRFIFEKYSWKIVDRDLKISFCFKIPPDIKFNPQVIINEVPKSKIKIVGEGVLSNLIFHLGLIEILSYWKATCSPKIEIKAGFLNKEQIKWWKELIIKGMGQFFYENKIDFRKRNFIEIISSQKSTTKFKIAKSQKKLKEKILVPIGGGKDSIVTLEILKQAVENIALFSLNPTKATHNIMKIAGFPTRSFRKKEKNKKIRENIVVRRKIDKRLLKLNREGFLNGHTPFSAYLAFLSVLVSAIFGQKYIAFSNERSSNEGNLKYLGKIINHQYSKTFEFEKKFREYSKKYLSKDIEYFSFLRPLYEIQIAKLFSKFPKYFSAFISCNVAFKTYSGTKKPLKKWCNNCPKCLFVFTCLYPFLGGYQIVRIFKENLFRRIGLLPIMLRLIGERDFKPFECVGTKKEALVAFYLSLKKAVQEISSEISSPIRANRRIPFLLKYFQNRILPKYSNLEKEAKKIMNSWNENHFLPKRFEEILKKTISF
jgi:hypothetical protein